VLKTLFLYSQNEKETIKEYGRNFHSLWDTVEAFGGLPGIYKGLVDGHLSNSTPMAKVRNPTNGERYKAEWDARKAVKAALLISKQTKNTRYFSFRGEPTKGFSSLTAMDGHDRDHFLTSLFGD